MDTRDASDAQSILTMQELDPSPVDDPDLENGEYFPQMQDANSLFDQSNQSHSFGAQKLGLSGLRWDHWLMAIQRYSTYPPSIFIALHAANTSIIPLFVRSVPESEKYLLLTRPIYQAPFLEPLILAIPIVAHVASGIVLRSMRARRRARLYGAETRKQRSLIQSWPNPSLQARLGYGLLPLLGIHVAVNRFIPLAVDGGSSSVGLGYAAHGFSRSPIVWNCFYALFVTLGVWHVVGGWASWMGHRVTTTRAKKGSGREGILGSMENFDEARRQRKARWVVYGVAALATAVWLAGGLGIVGRGGSGVGWEAKSWDNLYRQVPVIGEWL